MAWYDDRNRVSYLGTYKREKDARNDLEQALKRGWTLQDTTKDGGHINLGRTATGAVLTGGLSLLFGGSRDKGSVTLIFVRDPAAVAKAALESALADLKPLNDRALKSAESSERALAALRERARTMPSLDVLVRAVPEKQLRESLEQAIKQRSAAMRDRAALITAASYAQDRQDAAISLGVTVQSPYSMVVDDLGQLRDRQRSDGEWLKGAEAALKTQNAVERTAHDYSSRQARQSESRMRLDAAQHKLGMSQASLASAPSEKQASLQKAVDSATAEVAKRTSENAKADAELSASAPPLQEVLGQRHLLLDRLCD